MKFLSFYNKTLNCKDKDQVFNFTEKFHEFFLNL